MSETNPNKRGGQRLGAGRKEGTGPFGELTQPIRVPVSLLPYVKGLLSRMGKLPVTDQPTALYLPLLGSKIPAGFPSPADDHLEATINLNQQYISHPAATFFVRVQGHSMNEAGIHNGDMLVIDRSLEAKSGSIVIAVVNSELIVKRLVINDDEVWLMPETRNLNPCKLAKA